MLSEEKIVENHTRFIDIIQSFPDERAEALMNMYNDLGSEVYLAPASGVKHYHNAFPGGYLDHVLRVHDLSWELMKVWIKGGGSVEFTPDELKFACLHHDLGKLGIPGEPYYITQTSEWHREKRGEMYTMDPTTQYMAVEETTFFQLQKYGVKITRNELLGIKLADGAFKSSNSPYLEKTPYPFPMRTNIAYLVHWADWMAASIERSMAMPKS
jgi:hypothetical protein